MTRKPDWKLEEPPSTAVTGDRAERAAQVLVVSCAIAAPGPYLARFLRLRSGTVSLKGDTELWQVTCGQTLGT